MIKLSVYKIIKINLNKKLYSWRMLVACFSILWITQAGAARALHLDSPDLQYSAQDNFYLYVNGTWKKNNPIPADRDAWGAFAMLEHENLQRIHALLQEAAQNKHVQQSRVEQIVGDYFFTSQNVKRINAQGAKPLHPEFMRIQHVHDQQSLQKEIARLHMLGVNALFQFTNMQDFKDSTHMIGAVYQGGLTLPNRDYYVKNTPKFKHIRRCYLKHIQNMLQLIDESPAQARTDAKIILRMETKLAQASLSSIEQRDPHAIYHHVSLRKLQQETPLFIWATYFNTLGLPHLTHVNLAMPAFIHVMNQELQQAPLSTWKIYLTWHLLKEYAPYLSDPFVRETFNMTRALNGTEQMRPRWDRFIQECNLAIHFAIGELYVQRYFSPHDKTTVREIIHHIRQALHDDLQTLSWMQPETRQEALKKLALMEERVGYPDRGWDYSSLHIDRSSYVLNTMRANQFLFKHDLKKIDHPIDRTEWAMPPQSVNAYYDSSMNNINIPAGILQPPFFDPHASAAINYASIGWVIGHEMTHGFDDEGAQFDGQGNLHDWWQPQDAQTFKTLTQCIIKQFSHYTVEKKFHVQGQLVAGEAIADLGGLKLAYHAFHSLKGDAALHDEQGLTPNQQFFISAAHLWAMNIRKEKAINLVTVDPHPPAMYRVNGTLINMPEFLSSFHLPLNTNERCHIW